VRRAWPAVLAALAAWSLGAAPAAAQDEQRESAGSVGGRALSELLSPRDYATAPDGWERSADEAIAIAAREPKVRAARAKERRTYVRAFLKGQRQWQVSVFTRPSPDAKAEERRPREIAQVVVDDRSGDVLEAWDGHQVAWTMARGYPGQFGRLAGALYVWIPLCVAFLVPFLRPPLRLLHLDLAVLLSFSVSFAFFDAGEIGTSVPLAYPPLVYLLVRMLGVAFTRARGRSPAQRPPLQLVVPVAWLGIAVVFLLGFRLGLNLQSSSVIDVGYAGVVGADRLTDGESLYGPGWPADNEHGDTYGPVAYYAYVPFELAMPWSGTWDSLPAAHAAALLFDFVAVALLWLLGRAIRGPNLGIVLAYLWCTFPFTLLVVNCNANDALVAVLIMVVLLLVRRPGVRGAALAAAALTKFAPVVLAPLVATYRGGLRPGRWQMAGGGTAAWRAELPSLLRPAVVTAAAFAAATAVLLAPVLLDGTAQRFWARTLGFQGDRDSPFSLWGLYDLGAAQAAAAVGAALLAVAVAFVPRRRDIVVLCALGAAVLIAVQIAAAYWFYLYVVWFLPLVWVAILAPHAEPEAPR
jgi:hypothetical protein